MNKRNNTTNSINGKASINKYSASDYHNGTNSVLGVNNNNRDYKNSLHHLHQHHQQRDQQSTIKSKSSTGSSDTEPFYLHPPNVRQSAVRKTKI